MKKFIAIMAVLFVTAISASAQRTVTMSDLNGAITVNSATMTGPHIIQALCTETGGTADGTLNYQVSLDGTSWKTVTETAGMFYFYPNDTLTITDGAVWEIQDNSGFPYARIQGVGTSGDSTSVTIKYARR